MAGLTKTMALTLSEPVELAYMRAVDRLVVNICKHLKSGAASTADWETNRLADMGQLTRENAKIINATLKDVPQAIKNAMSEASKAALADVDAAIEKAVADGAIEPVVTDNVRGLVTDLTRQALDQCNLVNTVMLQSGQQAYLTVIQNTVMWEQASMSQGTMLAAQQMLNTYALGVVTGAETHRQALRKAIERMADNGIYGFVDRGGHNWSPEAYISMDIRTTCHNAAIQSIKTRQEDYGSDIFQVSYHAGARPLCYPYQNKFYSWGGGSGEFTDGAGQRHKYESINATSYGEPAGLFGINCGHYPLPQIPGVSIPTQYDVQDKAADDKQYAERQRQRALERNVRTAKRTQAALEAAGDYEGAAEWSAKVRDRQTAVREFCAETGRARRYDRESIAG